MEKHVQKDLKRGTLSVSDTQRKYHPIAFYIKFDGDLLVSTLDLLTKQVSTIVNVSKASIDQVIVVLSSPGGSVSSYGLASSQLVRNPSCPERPSGMLQNRASDWFLAMMLPAVGDTKY